jgi:hypothetical protein
MKTVVGTFDRLDDAKVIIEELNRRGISNDHIGIVAREATVREQLAPKEDDKDDELIGEGVSLGVAAGAGVGGIVGLLAGLGALAIPGMVPLYAIGTLAGVLVSMVTGGALGALSGGAIGAFADWGLSREQAEIYTTRVQEGAILLAAEVDEAAVVEIEHLFADFGGTHIHAVDDGAVAVR